VEALRGVAVLHQAGAAEGEGRRSPSDDRELPGADPGAEESNHHPKGSKIAWTASQPIKGGWLLAYRVKYEVKGKARFSQAAVAVTEVPDAKPAMLFVTIPDVQRSHWRDINTAVSSLRLK
jgi:hypothetical protein